MIADHILVNSVHRVGVTADGALVKVEAGSSLSDVDLTFLAPEKAKVCVGDWLHVSIERSDGPGSEVGA